MLALLLIQVENKSSVEVLSINYVKTMKPNITQAWDVLKYAIQSNFPIRKLLDFRNYLRHIFGHIYWRDP